MFLALNLRKQTAPLVVSMSPTPSPPPESPRPHAADDLSALSASAVALMEQGEGAQAIAILQHALAIDPAFAEGWLQLGKAHMQAESVLEAIAAYGRAITLEPTLTEAHANLAIAYLEQGRPDAAIEAFRAALAIDPTDFETLMDLGHLLQEQEQWEEAVAVFQRAQALSPSPALQAQLADLLVRQGDLEAAASHYRQALDTLTDTDGKDLQAQILARLGVALHQQGHLDDAIHTYGLALKLQPDLVAINTNRNAALQQLKAAVSQLRHGLHALPASDHAERAGLLTKLGVALQQAGCLEEAIATYGQALALDPELEGVRALRLAATEQHQDPTALRAIALRLNLLGLFEEEARTLEQAAALAPGDGAIQLERALSLLRLGRFEEGWPLYAWRGESFSHAIALPPWQSGMACDRLLILPEQGLGDQLMFASLLSEAAALAPKPSVMVDPRLRTLLARSFPHLPVLSTGQPFNSDQFQAQTWMGSLAGPLRPSKEHFLAHRQAFLKADPATTQALRRRHLPSLAQGQRPKGELLVGLSWSSTSPANGFMKSIPLETLAGALALPGVRLLSLQYGDTRSERDALRRATGLEVHADPQIDTFNDIDNLASLIAACDVVVSISNITAHLAGALGQPTWLLIDSRLDWRWGLTDTESLWYPNARLFRQSAAGDWTTPLQAIQAELRALRGQGMGVPAVPWQGADPSPRAGAPPPPDKWVF